MIGLAPFLTPQLIRAKRTAGRRQIPFLMSPVVFRAFVAGRGSGKTVAGAWAGLQEAGRLRGSTGVVVAPTYTMLSDDVVPVFRHLAGRLIVNFNRTDMEAQLSNGSRVLFRSASNREHVNRLRGISASWFWLEEAAHVPDGENCWKILLPILREFRRMGRGWLTTTPRGKGWIYQLFGLSQDPDYALFTSHTRDNEFTSPKYKQAIETAYGVGWFAKQELAGEFCDPEGTLFQRAWFKDHIIDAPLAPLVNVCRGWDLACTTNTTSDYTAGVRMGVDAEGRYYVLDVVHGKWQWPETQTNFAMTAQLDGACSEHYVEQGGFQTAAVQDLLARADLAPYAIQGQPVTRDKLSNALPVASRAQAGKLYLIRGAWNTKYIDELCAFSGNDKDVDHDDQVDGTSIAYHALASGARFGFRTFDDE